MEKTLKILDVLETRIKNLEIGVKKFIHDEIKGGVRGI